MIRVARPHVVLLVEDEPADVHLVKLALNESGIDVKVDHVVDGREALAHLRHEGSRFANTERPDLILLDLNMPRMDGHEFLAAIKNDGTLRDIPVVVLSTSEVERDVRSAYRLGAAGYIAKSPDFDQFTATIGHLSAYWFTLVRLPLHG